MKTIVRAVAGLAIILAVCAPAVADIAVGAAKITRVSNYFSGNGGEFTIGDSALSNAAYHQTDASNINSYSNDFQSFCVELNEHVSIPQNVFIIVSTSGASGSQAVNGGVGGGSPDPLDPLTAYLYTQFAKGVLTGYDYIPGAGRQASAAALQEAIWYIENEFSAGHVLSAAAQDFYDDAVAAAWTNIGNVRVLNLYADAGYTELLQDQLYLVPAPGAAFLVFAGLGLVGWIRKRLA